LRGTAQRAGAVPCYLGLAIALGIAFTIVKFFEYSAKLEAGLTMMTNTFTCSISA